MPKNISKRGAHPLKIFDRLYPKGFTRLLLKSSYFGIGERVALGSRGPIDISDFESKMGFQIYCGVQLLTLKEGVKPPAQNKVPIKFPHTRRILLRGSILHIIIKVADAQIGRFS